MAGEIIRPSALPDRPNPVASEKVPVDNGVTVGGATIQSMVEAGRPAANQAEAEAGINATKAMTPLTTKQAIDAQVPSKIDAAITALNLGSAAQAETTDFATSAQGAKADTAVQSIVAGDGVSVDSTDPQNPIVSIGGTGGAVIGPSSAVDGEEVVFDGTSGSLIRSAGPSSSSLTVSPIAIDMHFGTLAGVGWQASDPGNIVATTATGSGANTITVASATGFFVGQLICYVATNGQYYSAVIKGISSLTFTLDRNLPAPISVGAGVYNFYRDDAHPNQHGFACLADDALRQATLGRELVHVGANPAQWSAFGSATLTSETSATYINPGSSIASEQGVKVTGSVSGAGAVSREVTLNGGTYVTEVVVNVGTRDSGPSSGSVEVNVIAVFPDGTSNGVGYYASAGFGGSIVVPAFQYRVPRGTKISIRVTSTQATAWTFYVGMIRHHRISGRLRSLNKGRHVVYGDSWAAGGDFVARLTASLTNAVVINEGISGAKSADLIAGFNADVAPHNPTFVWIIVGTNDVYAEVTPTQFQANVERLILFTQSIGAVPIIFNPSVCSAIYVPAPGPRLDLSRQYAIRSLLLDQPNEASGFGIYTPAWTASGGNPAIGNGTITGTWTKNGKLVTASIALTMGSTTTYGSGPWSFGLPEPAANAALLGGQGVFGLDAGLSVRAGMTRASTSTAFTVIDIAALNNWSATVPHTWAVGDQISLTVVYQAAG